MPVEGEERFQFRLTADAAANVDRMRVTHGLSQRSCVEIAFEVSNWFCLDAEARRLRLPQFDSEVLEDLVKRGWVAAHFVQSRHAVRGETDKVTFTPDVDSLQKESLEVGAKDRDLNLSAVVATAFTPWSPRWGPKWCERGDPAYQLRQDLFEWLIPWARERDFERQRRSSLDEPPVGTEELPGDQQE